MKEKIQKSKERGIITMRKQRKKLNKRNNSNCVGDYNYCSFDISRCEYCNANRRKWNINTSTKC